MYAQDLNGVLKVMGCIMDFDKIMKFLEIGDVGLTISVEDTDILDVRVKEKNVDLNILDMDKLEMLKEELKKWKA